MKFKKSQIDLLLYTVLFIVLTIWAIKIRLTCEELGCLAIIFPIFGIIAISGIEFIINIIICYKKKKINLFRKIILAVSGTISIISLILITTSFFQ